MYGFRSSAVNFWRANGGGLVGKGCVGQVSSPGISDARHGPLLDGPQRLAGDAIEDPHESLLAHLRHRVDASCRRAGPCSSFGAVASS